MLGLRFGQSADGPLSILCLGAHSDDIEIGAGGTLLELADRHPDARVAWHVFSAGGVRRSEAEASAAYFTRGFAEANIVIHDFRDGHFPIQLSKLKSSMEAARSASEPDVVFTHFRRDLHQDHRTVAEVTWQTFRDALIFEYEIVKYDGDLAAPNCYFPISREHCSGKIEALERYFQSQRNKDWFSAETFSALMRVRGIECRAPGGYAEAFHVHKAIVCA